MKLLVLLAAALALTASNWHIFRAHGISVRYPSGWFATARRLTLVTYPPQIIAVASYRLPRGNGGADG